MGSFPVNFLFNGLKALSIAPQNDRTNSSVEPMLATTSVTRLIIQSYLNIFASHWSN